MGGSFDTFAEFLTLAKDMGLPRGYFFGSADIKAQLPTEWSRFQNVDAEVVSLNRRISLVGHMS